MSFRDDDNPEGCTMTSCFCGQCGTDEEGFRYKQTGDILPEVAADEEEPDRHFRTIDVSQLSAPNQPMVTFIVGPDNNKQEFKVYKGLACTFSPFFKAAFESDMAEGQTQRMRLEDVEGGIFAMLVHYLNHQELDQASFVQVAVMGDDVYSEYDFVLLAKLWKLAERFLIADIQNVVIVELLRHRDRVFTERLKEFAMYVCSTDGDFKDAGPRGALKRVLLELVAYNRHHEICMGVLEIMPFQMVLEVASMLKEKLPIHHEQRGRHGIQEQFFVELQGDVQRLGN
ncbi:hypothetical protein VTL71DRAFT_4513 [Oculimacula yallundae]|uniref:BTB domain-containing protein n=1 Tax=Oculimacula yallundae TaxID=86028 RepID=A0ABR4C290_9HELO